MIILKKRYDLNEREYSERGGGEGGGTCTRAAGANMWKVNVKSQHWHESFKVSQRAAVLWC